MLKFRYFQVRLPCSFDDFAKMAVNIRSNSSTSEINVVRRLKGQIILQTRFTRYISTKILSLEGNVVTTAIPTIDTYTIKIFEENKKFYLCCNDPPRGTKFIEEILGNILYSEDYFFEAIDLDRSLISTYIAHFKSFKLVSAKIRDFHVYNNAVGRLEISSHDGLLDEIAPFLKGKHYKIDAFTYSISHGHNHGLIYFSRNGTLRLSDALADVAVPLFERVLGETL